jgi:hypothetical protein
VRDGSSGALCGKACGVSLNALEVVEPETGIVAPRVVLHEGRPMSTQAPLLKSNGETARDIALQKGQQAGIEP